MKNKPGYLHRIICLSVLSILLSLFAAHFMAQKWGIGSQVYAEEDPTGSTQEKERPEDEVIFDYEYISVNVEWDLSKVKDAKPFDLKLILYYFSSDTADTIANVPSDYGEDMAWTYYIYPREDDRLVCVGRYSLKVKLADGSDISDDFDVQIGDFIGTESPGSFDVKITAICHHENTAVKNKKAASCTQKGYSGDIYCVDCNEVLEKGTDEEKLAHKYKSETVPATLTKSGYKAQRCSVCKTVKDKVIYSYPKTIALSKTVYTYTGKAIKPAVTVKGADGKVIANTNYTLTYSNAKSTNVGKYTVKVVFKGNYSGTKTLVYKINPKPTSIVSFVPATKAFTVKWTKITTQTSGYQIQYSTSSTFASPKTVTLTSNTSISKRISSLTAKKKYFVKVRTYKTVNGVKYFSSWSAVKTVTTK